MVRHKSRLFNKDQLTLSLRKKLPWTNSFLVLGLAFAGLLFFGRAALRVHDNKEESARAAAEASVQLAELEHRKEFLESSLNRLSTSEGQATELRKRFGVAYPGENVAIIVEGNEEEVATTSPGFWSSVKGFFGF